MCNSARYWSWPEEKAFKENALVNGLTRVTEVFAELNEECNKKDQKNEEKAKEKTRKNKSNKSLQPKAENVDVTLFTQHFKIFQLPGKFCKLVLYYHI